MTDEEKSEFINETIEKTCDWLASEKSKIKQAIKEGLEKGLAEGRKELEKENAELKEYYHKKLKDEENAINRIVELTKENEDLFFNYVLCSTKSMKCNFCTKFNGKRCPKECPSDTELFENYKKGLK